ncbi:YvrJ family protein [Geobacillus stearothermophilus]|uniref:YvrJ family protein n=1 Tax=Geobacillus stearothermophilus TaxID=1422 RepID=UPI003D194ABB
MSGDKDGTWRSEILYYNLYIYLLYRMETKLDQLTKSIQDLTIALSRGPQN